MKSIQTNIIKALMLLHLLSGAVAKAAEAECEPLKDKLLASSKLSPRDRSISLVDLEQLILKGEDCAKNLLGRIYYEGGTLPKDVNKAHEIFYDLSLKGYPPATFNLAYLSIKESRESPENIVGLLQGLMIKFSGDRQWGHISASSRELAWDYLDEIKHSGNTDISKITELRIKHQRLSTDTTAQLANAVQSRTDDLRGQADAIVGLLSIGLAANAIGQRAAIASRPTTFSSPAFTPRLYSVTPTGSSNILYLIPH
jgi:hypothetical protein